MCPRSLLLLLLLWGRPRCAGAPPPTAWRRRGMMTKGPRRRRRRRRPDLPRRSFKRAAADGQDGVHRTGSLRSYAKSLHAASCGLFRPLSGASGECRSNYFLPSRTPLCSPDDREKGAEKCSPSFLSPSPSPPFLRYDSSSSKHSAKAYVILRTTFSSSLAPSVMCTARTQGLFFGRMLLEDVETKSCIPSPRLQLRVLLQTKRRSDLP